MLMTSSPAIAAQEITLSMETAVKLAIEQNLDLKAKREELGIAEGRLIRSNLFLQHNPELEGDLSNRRLKNPEEGFPKNLTQGGVALSQEFEFAGQPTYLSDDHAGHGRRQGGGEASQRRSLRSDGQFRHGRNLGNWRDGAASGAKAGPGKIHCHGSVRQRHDRKNYRSQREK